MIRKTWHLNTMAILCASALLLASGARAADAAREAALIQILQSDAPHMEKDAACRELQIIGTVASVPALAALLPDQALSHIARYALEPMPGPEAGKALRDALATTTGAAKVGVIGSLGYREDKPAAKLLVPLLKDSDAQVAAAAAAALGRIGNPQAGRALKQFRGEAPAPLKAVAAEASLAFAESFVRRGKSERAVAIYKELQTSEWPEYVRLGAFTGLMQALPDEAVARAISAIQGDDALLRSVAIANIATLKSPEVAGRLAAELPNVASEVQVQLIEALADCGEPATLPAMTRATADANAEVRLTATEALGKMGDAQSVATLCKIAAEGQSAAEKAAALTSLERLRGDGINAALLEAMKTAPESVRPSLIGVLADRNATDAVGAILQEAKGSNAAVSLASFKALRRLGSEGDVPALLAILVASQDDAVRSEGERTAAALARKGSDESTRADVTLAALKNTTDTKAVCSLLRVLGGIGNAPAFGAVRGALESESADVRDTALRVLVAWPDATALDTLVGALAATEDPTHRVLILRGCVRLLGLDSGSAEAKLATYRKLMAAAQRPADRKLVLGGLASVASVEALDLIEPSMADAEVRAEAELAMLGVAAGIANSAPAAAKKTAQRLQTESTSEAVRKQAGDIINTVEQFEDFIVSWEVSGPYLESGKDGSQIFDVAFAPEKEGAQAKWSLLSAGTQSERPYMLDLAKALGGDQCAGYARTYVHSEKAQEARLEMGADDSIKAWLDGEEVYKNGAAGAAAPGEDKVVVNLKEGWNLLTLKIVQHTGPWEFCARLRAPDGGRLEGVRVGATRESAAPLLEAKEPAPALWGPLFNGKDLSGWQATGDAIFTVEKGCIVGTQTTGKGGDLWSENEWTDFDLLVVYRVEWPANSGFWFRHDGNVGYQFDVLKYTNPVAFSGTLYCPGKMFLTANKDESIENRDGWNEARIRAHGEELTLWLNGKMTGQCRDNTLSSGKIGVQVHGGDDMKNMKIVIREIEIAPVKASGTPESEVKNIEIKKKDEK